MPNLSSTSNSSMSRPIPTNGSYVCKKCRAGIANKREVVSWAFRGYNGKAALVHDVVNVTLAKPTILLMNTGAYTVQDFTCGSCTTALGWRIIKAHERTEKWKEGHYVLEMTPLLEDSNDLSPEEFIDFDIVTPSPRKLPLPPSRPVSRERGKGSRTPSPLPPLPTTTIKEHHHSHHRTTISHASLTSSSEIQNVPPQAGTTTSAPRVMSLQVPKDQTLRHKRSTSDTSVNGRSKPLGPRIKSLRAGE